MTSAKIKTTIGKSHIYSLFLLFVTAFIFRLISLNQSLWLDEVVVAQTVRRYLFVEIITRFSPTDFHPPLYYLFMDQWTNVFGYGEVALRFPSVIFSLLAGLIVYRLARELAGSHAAGWWAAAFLLFNPLIIYYSQEARMYMMVVFLASALLYLLRRELFSHDKKTHSTWIGVGIAICASLLLGTFYGSIFYIAAIFFVLVWRRQTYAAVVLGASSLSTLLLLAPLLSAQIQHSTQMLISVSNWSLVLGRAEFKNMALIPIKFATGRYDLDAPTDYILALGWTAVVYGSVVVVAIKAIINNKKSKTHTTKEMSTSDSPLFILCALIIVPILLAYIVSFAKPMMQYFRYLYVVAPLSILFVLLIRWSWMRCVLLFGFAAWSLIYLLNPAHHREDWKSLAASLPPYATVTMIPSAADPIHYYRPDVQIVDIGIAPSAAEEIIVIPYVTNIHGVDYVLLLKSAGYKKREETSFRDLTYEAWIRNAE